MKTVLSEAARREIVAEAMRPASLRRPFEAIGRAHGISKSYVSFLVWRTRAAGRDDVKVGPNNGYTEACLTAPVKHRPAVAPPMIPGLTVAALMSGRASVSRRRRVED